MATEASDGGDFGVTRRPQEPSENQVNTKDLAHGREPGKGMRYEGVTTELLPKSMPMGWTLSLSFLTGRKTGFICGVGSLHLLDS